MRETRLSIHVHTDSSFLAPMREMLAIYLRSHGVYESVISDLLLVVQEALTNVVRHAYRACPPGLMHLDAMREGDQVVVRIVDAGPPYNPTERPDPDLDEPRTGGYGVFLIRQLTDNVEYTRNGDLNVLTLRRSLPHQTQPVDGTG